MGSILWTIISVLVILWLLGFVLHFGGSLIHVILLVAVVLVVINLMMGRGARAS
ncbi:MAG: lmo0937 family membrane protein [Candidatus Cybelea sp.]